MKTDAVLMRRSNVCRPCNCTNYLNSYDVDIKSGYSFIFACRNNLRMSNLSKTGVHYTVLIQVTSENV